jgi:hypothetical protein
MTLLVSMPGPDGTIKRFKPISQRSLKRSHENGNCWFLCSYCEADIQEYIKANDSKDATP